MIKISTEFDKLDYTFNRSLSTVVTLPYDKDDVLLGVNELVNGYNFNSCVEKLQSNLMYLYSVSKLADPNIPTQYEGFIGTATYSGDYLDIGIMNFTPYTQGVAAFTIKDYSEMPYFYVTDSDNNTHNIIFSYEGTVNPDTTDGTIPSGTTTTIELNTAQYGNDLAAVYGARQALSAYFAVNTYEYNERWGGLNSKPVMELSSFNIGGTFFGNADFATIGSLLSDEPAILTVEGVERYQQGSTLQLFKLFTNTNTEDLHETIIDKNFNNLKSISIGPGTLSGYNCVFCCSPDHISALSANTTSTLSADYTFTNVTSSIGINNDLNFQGINASAYAKNTLYVSDSTNNSVYRINVNGFTRDDNIRNNNFYETEIIGGLGGVRDNYSFNNPKILQYHNDELYVLDQGNNCIKIYDQDLGFVRNLRKTAFTKNNPPATIKMYNNNFYWLTTTGILFILDDDLNPLKSTKLYNDSNSEEFIDFIVAKDNNNIYVSTRENIYKYFFDNLEFIGRFNLSNNKIDNTSIEFLSQIDVGDDTNRIYTYGKRNGYGTLLVFNEKNGFETLLSNYTFDIYSLDEIKVDKNEFVSNFSYNKSIIKLLSNNLQLSNYISNNVSVTLLRDGGLQFDGITYFDDSELKLLNYDPTLDNYIGTNEIFSRTVANRVLNKIYEYQLLLVKLFSNQVTPPQEQVNILSPGLMGLMLEDFPGNANGYYRLEQGKNNRDAILLEDRILEQQEVVAPPPPPEPPPPPPPRLPCAPDCIPGWYNSWEPTWGVFPEPGLSQDYFDNSLYKSTLLVITVLPNGDQYILERWPSEEVSLPDSGYGIVYAGDPLPPFGTGEWDFDLLGDGSGHRADHRYSPLNTLLPDQIHPGMIIKIIVNDLFKVGWGTNSPGAGQSTGNRPRAIAFKVRQKWRECIETTITAKTPYTDENMFSGMSCSEPLNLLVAPAGYNEMASLSLHPAFADFYGGEFTHTGFKTYKTINQNNDQILNVDFNMYKVPLNPENVGPWDYIAIDTTSYNYNKNLQGTLNDCFVESDFLVYFKFQKTGNEPNAFFNNTKAEEYRLKFEEGAAGYFGNVYDINGCHLYKLSNGGQRVNNTDQEGKEGGTTIPVHVLAKTIPVHIKELAVEG